MAEITKRPPKTLKQKLWAKIYVKTKNATEAAMQAYDCKDRKAAATIGFENLRKLDFEDILEAIGLDDIAITKPIVEGLEANRTISATVIIKTDDPKVKTKQATARDVDFIDVPDHIVRLKASQMALELKDKFPSKKVEVGTGGQELIESWKKEKGVDEASLDKEGEDEQSLRDIPKLGEGDLPKGPLPVPNGNLPKNS